MVKDLLVWRFIEGVGRKNVLEGVGDHAICSPKLGFIVIKGNSVTIPSNCLVSYISPMKKENMLLLDHHYNESRPVKRRCDKPLQVEKIGILFRVFFSRFDDGQWTYPFLDLIRILPSVDRIKMIDQFRVRADVDDQGKLTGRACMVWGRNRPKGKNTKTFLSFNSFFEDYNLQ